jgi:hypothetical protein
VKEEQTATDVGTDKESRKEANAFLDDLSIYRKSLLSAEQQMQTEYDKGVMTLSGGALGISFAFLKDVVGEKELLHGSFLLWAWIFWAVSIACILTSYFTSAKSLRDAAVAVDQQTIYLTLAKGAWVNWTKGLNVGGGVAFLLGVVFLFIFVANNLPK